MNIGVGALATTKRPADAALRPLMSYYTDLRREEWGFDGEPRAGLSALLPMGGAVSGVAGPNWMLIGDAAACVNPLNGEGIDYGLETGRLRRRNARQRRSDRGVARGAAAHYARGFSVARRLALLLTIPRFLPTIGSRRDAVAAFLMQHRRAGDGQPRHRRGRRLDRAGLAARRALSRRIDRRPPFS